jgi:hypothetical protein
MRSAMYILVRGCHVLALTSLPVRMRYWGPGGVVCGGGRDSVLGRGDGLEEELCSRRC